MGGGPRQHAHGSSATRRHCWQTCAAAMSAVAGRRAMTLARSSSGSSPAAGALLAAAGALLAAAGALLAAAGVLAAHVVAAAPAGRRAGLSRGACTLGSAANR